VTQPLSAQMVPAARSPESIESTADFSAFYERWHSQLLDYVKSTCGARDAEEITQETMARALTSLDLSSEHARQWRWLRVVARNVATDLGRSRKLCDVASDAPCDVERVAATNIEQQLLDSECLQELHHVLTALSPKQSQAWWLTIAEGMPPTAIASTLGCSPESVRQALFKTRRKLMSAMAPFCERVEGFGAIGVLAVLMRRVRGFFRPAKHATAPAPLALAAASVVGTLAFLAVPAHLHGSVHLPATRHPALHTAANSTAAHVAPGSVAGRSSVAASHQASVAKPALRVPVNRPAASVGISRHPLSPGTTATARLSVDTPAGSVSVETTFNRGPDRGTVCHRTALLCG
jgi:RNA polymerase sigma factor (sigma-70 family)